MNKKTLGTLVLIWLGWFTVLYIFQSVVFARYDVARPDTAVSWSQYETEASSASRSVYLQDPFLNNQVAWDSEYYLGTAIGGYDDACVPAIFLTGRVIVPCARSAPTGLPISFSLPIKSRMSSII